VGVIFTERLPPTRYVRALIGIGFLGAHTTFSAMALEGVRLITAGRVRMGPTYGILTLIVGQMASVYGMWLGRLEFVRAKGKT